MPSRLKVQVSAMYSATACSAKASVQARLSSASSCSRGACTCNRFLAYDVKEQGVCNCRVQPSQAWMPLQYSQWNQSAAEEEKPARKPLLQACSWCRLQSPVHQGSCYGKVPHL